MTPEEKIKVAIHCLGFQAEQEVCEECPVYNEGRIACTEVARSALKALKEIQQYREIGTVEECQEAVEKQKPKIIRIKDWSPSHCPTCDYELSTLGDGYYKNPTFLGRCPECGQAIQWKESERK